MNKCAFALMFLLIASPAVSQTIRATTDDGRVVRLKPDGTWQFAVEAEPPNITSLNHFQKPSGSTLSYTSRGGAFVVWFDPAEWSQKESDDPSRGVFVHKDGDVYGVVIAERAAMDIQALKNMAINNARKIAPDIKVTMEEERVVNETRVFCMKMEGTTQGISFVYYGYYYTGKAGTIQLLTYTYPNIFDQYEDIMTAFLNGLIIKS